jgi:hypothetical protein
MSDISTLEKKVSDLTSSIQTWNRAYVWALGIALLVGAFSFWAQRQAILRSGELVTASNDLSKEKDRQLQRDLKEKDEAIAKLDKERAEAEKSLLELQERFAPRTVSPEQRTTFLKEVASEPKGKVSISVVTGDPEAFAYATKLFELLRDAGYDVGPQVTSFTLFGQPPVGLTASILNQTNPPPFADALLRGLKLIDANVRGIAGDKGKIGLDDTSIALEVGAKQ